MAGAMTAPSLVQRTCTRCGSTRWCLAPTAAPYLCPNCNHSPYSDRPCPICRRPMLYTGHLLDARCDPCGVVWPRSRIGGATHGYE